MNCRRVISVKVKQTYLSKFFISSVLLCCLLGHKHGVGGFVVLVLCVTELWGGEGVRGRRMCQGKEEVKVKVYSQVGKGK